MPAPDIVGEWVPVGDLVPWDQNPRDNDQSVDEVAGSIRRFGFAAPIIARRADSMVIAGHTRLKAAQRLGINKVPVRWMDLDPSEARMLALADNKLNERADWDDDLLSGVLAQLQEDGADLEGLGWDDEEIDALIADAGPEVELPEDIEPAEPPRVPDSKPGEVYELGPHRLVCGDSTDPASWEDLLAGDDDPRMVWTDPPYGIAYKALKRKEMHRDIAGDASLEDARSTLDEVLGCLPLSIKALFLCCDWKSFSMMRDSLETIQRNVKDLIIWDKGNRCHNLSRYAKIYEMILYAGPYGGQPTKADNIWRVPREFREDHPTPKPVELVVIAVETASNPGDMVIDPFGGSGSCVIACARTGRAARVIEMDPGYCDVIRDRWTRWAIEAGQDPGPGALTLERD